MNRKLFEDLPGKENPQFLEDGKRIYYLMKSKYPNEDIESLDNILGIIRQTFNISVIKSGDKIILQ